MLKWIFSGCLCLLLITSSLKAQVINIESKRFLNDTNGWVGNADASFNIAQNVSQVLTLATTARLQYAHNRHRWMFLQDLGFVKAGTTNYVNTGFQHLRYSYKIHHLITMEAFVQGQYNPVLKLDFRFLTGVGPRFKLLKTENYRIYFATLYMYEYDKVHDHPSRLYEHRLSPYLTFTFVFAKGLELSNTTFYQPSLADFRDYRIADDLVLELSINKYLSFKCSYNLLYDTRQPEGIPTTIYSLRNSLSFKF